MVTRPRSMPDKVYDRIDELLTAATQQSGEVSESWKALEEAHILSQRWASTHVRVHWAMLGLARRSSDRSEAVGQLSRLLLAAPGSLSRRYPIGNTGRAHVSAFKPMPVQDDLVALLATEQAKSDDEVLDSDGVKRLYDGIAPLYDTAAAPFRLLRGRRLALQAIAELHLNHGDTVVDLGTGTGWNLPHLVDRVGPTGHVIGVDISPRMLDQARRNIGEIDNVDLIEADIATYKPPPGTDAVISTFAIEMRPDYDTIIERLAATIKPNSRIAVTGLRHADHWPAWVSDLGSRLMRFFGVNDNYRSHRPWQAIQNHTTNAIYQKSHGGVVYLAAGTTPEPRTATKTETQPTLT